MKKAVFPVVKLINSLYYFSQKLTTRLGSCVAKINCNDSKTPTTGGKMARYLRPTAQMVADYFIGIAKINSRPITNLKLQKLLYYSQAWYMVFNDGKLLFNDKIEAWVHGPAVRKVYGHFKAFGFKDIEKIVDFHALCDNLSERVKSVLGQVWKVYGNYDAKYLEILTHSERPWQKAREGVDDNKSSTKEISTLDMMEFYSAMLASS